MKKINLEEAKLIQMNVLDVIHKFCVNNNIKYTLSNGTLIGAIRHKGYIPWDDDLDIYMLREDYDKLIKEFPKEFDNIKIASLERDEKWYRPYANAYDNRTLKIEKSTALYNIGMGIDIFPIDIVPEDVDEWLCYNKKRLFLQRIYAMKLLEVSQSRSLLKNIAILLSRIILFPFSARSLAICIDKYIRQYARDSLYVFETSQGLIIKNRFFKSDFEECIDMPFEDRTYKVMKGYDRYLSLAYGDYMKLPPVEKQVSHHDYSVYWV